MVQEIIARILMHRLEDGDRATTFICGTTE